MLIRLWQRLTTEPVVRDRAAAIAWLLVGLVAFQFEVWPLWPAVAMFMPTGEVFLATLVTMAALILLRSRRPITQLLANTAMLAVDLAHGGSLGALCIYADSVFSAVRYSSPTRLRQATWVALVAAVGGFILLVITRPATEMLLMCVQLALLMIISIAWAWSVRSEQIRTRLELTAASQVANQQLRTLVAHDLHDLVANQIAVAGLHIEAAKLQAAKSQGSGGEGNALLTSLGQAKRGTDLAHAELRALITLLTEAEHIGNATLLDIEGEITDLDAMLPGERALVWPGIGPAMLQAILDEMPQPRARVLVRVLRELIANATKHGVGDVSITIEPSAEISGDGALSITIDNAIDSPIDKTVEGSNLRMVRHSQGSGIGISGASTLLSTVRGSLTISTISAEKGISELGPSAWRAHIRVPLDLPDGVTTRLCQEAL